MIYDIGIRSVPPWTIPPGQLPPTNSPLIILLFTAHYFEEELTI